VPDRKLISFQGHVKGKNTSERSAVDWKLVGRRIRELRGFDLTQEEFARRIGVSQNYLSTMEHGKVQIGAEILLRISGVREINRVVAHWRTVSF
jgi:DNA-binding transcriptional regulator YiaG